MRDHRHMTDNAYGIRRNLLGDLDTKRVRKQASLWADLTPVDMVPLAWPKVSDTVANEYQPSGTVGVLGVDQFLSGTSRTARNTLHTNFGRYGSSTAEFCTNARSATRTWSSSPLPTHCDLSSSIPSRPDSRRFREKSLGYLPTTRGSPLLRLNHTRTSPRTYILGLSAHQGHQRKHQSSRRLLNRATDNARAGSFSVDAPEFAPCRATSFRSTRCSGPRNGFSMSRHTEPTHKTIVERPTHLPRSIFLPRVDSLLIGSF